jgi:5-methyltetrahydrofolate--homocysteine methyltransferase
MSTLSDLLSQPAPILLDGAMGTMLMSAGLNPGDSPELWNVERPYDVARVHRLYIQAGSQLILTNSFGGSRVRLERNGLAGRAFELNRAAAELASQEAVQADHAVLVAGSMGPTGELLQPYGPLTLEQAENAFAEQAAGLIAGGADLLWIETMSDLNEVQAAIAGARRAIAEAGREIPIVATMTFDARGRTMMGVRPEQAVQALAALDLLAVGANCGTGPAEVALVIDKMKAAAPEAVLVVKANAGLPRQHGGQVVYDGTPEVMAQYALDMRTRGAKLIGACCGSTPEHIQAMAEALAANC